MKIILFIFILFSTSAFAFHDEPDGFRNIKWGSSVPDIHGLKIISISTLCEHIKRAEYVKENEILVFMNITFFKIIYVFINDKLTEVNLLGTGYMNAQKIKDALFKKYFEGELNCNELMFNMGYKWLGNKTNIFLDYYGSDVLNDTKFKLTFNSSKENKEQIEHLRIELEKKKEKKGTEL